MPAVYPDETPYDDEDELEDECDVDELLDDVELEDGENTRHVCGSCSHPASNIAPTLP